MAYNGTLSRGTAAFAAGKFGQGLSGGVFALPALPALVTVECWAKITSTTGTVVAVGSSTSTHFWLGIRNGKAAMGNPGQASVITTSGVTIGDGLWHHLAIVADGTSCRLYVDGAQASSIAFTGGIVASTTTAIAGLGTITTYDWAAAGGMVDEVRLSTTARYTGTPYTAPTAAFTDDVDTAALYHLETDATDSHMSVDTTAPTVPGTPTATAGVSSASVAFSASTDAVGVTAYEVFSSADGYATAVATGSASPITVTGLTNGTSYTFKVRALDAAGNASAQSAASNSVTPTASITVPGQPTGLAAAPGNGQAALTWTAPASNGGAAITDYVVQYRTTAGPGAWTTFADGTSATTSATVTGLTNGTGYDFQVAPVNSAGTGAYSAAASATPSASGPTIPAADGNIIYSPYTWAAASGAMKTINAGAYFRALLQGNPTAIALNFDVTGVAAPLPQITVLVDGIAILTAPVAASVPITIPSGPTWQKRLLEVAVKATTETATRWSTQATAVKFLGITTTPGTVTTAAAQTRGLRGLVYGDSITEGVRTLNSTATSDTDRNDATVGWAYRLGADLGAEVGVVGFGSTGLADAGSGGVPALTGSYNLLWAGQARSFTPAPDFIVLMEGTNDGSNDTVAAATTVLNGLLAATPSATKVIVLRPFNGTAQAANLQAAVAACTTPSRVSYVDTAGWWSTADSSDNLHPYGYINIAQIAPRVAAAVRAALPSSGSGRRFINKAGVAVSIG